ncbi:MAG TPA: hypothetical protein VKD26_00480, partial [Streptosporangiaceae bacterium]|nr:hypothetical protein [Streptosporangiaceae bacterium]
MEPWPAVPRAVNRSQAIPFSAACSRYIRCGPDVVRDFVHHDSAIETDYAGALVTAMEEALTSQDAGALPVPYCLSAGTDA